MTRTRTLTLAQVLKRSIIKSMYALALCIPMISSAHNQRDSFNLSISTQGKQSQCYTEVANGRLTVSRVALDSAGRPVGSRITLFSTTFKQADVLNILSLFPAGKNTNKLIVQPALITGETQTLNIHSTTLDITYSMWNQGDSSSFRIYEILNTYLPAEYKLHSLLTDWEKVYQSRDIYKPRE